MLIGLGVLMTENHKEDTLYSLGEISYHGNQERNNSVARFSTETEYWALANAAAELTCL